MSVFEAGKYYQQEKGRRIKVADETVNTVLWGPTLVVEAYDDHGYEISTIAIATMPDITDEWVEISHEEYMRNFIYVPCERCGRYLEKGQKFIRADEGVYHSECFNPTMEGAPDAVDLIKTP